MNQELLPLLRERPSGEIAERRWQTKLLDTFQGLPVRSVSDIVPLASDTERSLAGISRKYGPGSVRALLVILLSDFVDFFSVGKEMGGRQIAITAEMIREEYYYLTVEDFRVFFSAAIKGRYGKVYNRMDGSVIMEWLSEYARERADTFEESNYIRSVSGKDRFIPRGDVVKVSDRELERVLGTIKTDRK